MVRMTGFEPAASCSQSKRSTKLSHIRLSRINLLYMNCVKKAIMKFIFITNVRILSMHIFMPLVEAIEKEWFLWTGKNW